MAAGTNAIVSLTSQTTSGAVPVNLHGTGNIPIGIVLDFTAGTGVGTASAEFTFDDPSDANAKWFAFPDLSGKTATTVSQETMPARAVRLNVTAYTSGTISMRVCQGVK